MLNITENQLQKLAGAGFTIDVIRTKCSRAFSEVLIGIKFPEKHVYNWFLRTEFEGEEPSQDYRFLSTYCQASGKVRKGIKYGWKIEDRINRALGKLGQ
jgi:hypothetical protein